MLALTTFVLQCRKMTSLESIRPIPFGIQGSLEHDIHSNR
jgi:hypothetical protein